METNKAIDILKMAILMEKRGFAFYTKVAENTPDPEIKHIFLVMAEEETKHVKFLADQFMHYGAEHKFAYNNLPDLEHEAFTTLILTEELKQKISAAGFEAAAISAAIDFEKKAIEVYSNQAKVTADPNEKALYNWLADWEKGHLKILNDIDNELKEKIWNDNQFWPF
ncbi:MAG: ferritin family protein [Bacteroidota bacterium]